MRCRGLSEFAPRSLSLQEAFETSSKRFRDTQRPAGLIEIVARFSSFLDAIQSQAHHLVRWPALTLPQLFNDLYWKSGHQEMERLLTSS
jgi:hypothetical protein